MSGTLRVHEIYLSLQGESTFAGLPCVFIRLTGCDLRCGYILLPAGEHGQVITFSPPLTITEKQLERTLATLQKVMS